MLKATVAELLGNEAWLDLKETTSLATWRGYVVKLIDAIKISIQTSIEIRDDAWANEVSENLERGRASAKSAANIEVLLSEFSTTLLRQVFIQIGMCPSRSAARAVSLGRENWRLNGHRSVQYVQSPAQIESAFWSEQQQRIGFEKQMELRTEHRESRSKLPFSRWCKERVA